MYIIEFQDKWIKKSGKLSFCKVVKNKKAKEELEVLYKQYLKDISELIFLKLDEIEQEYDVSDEDVQKIKDLITELKYAKSLKNKY